MAKPTLAERITSAIHANNTKDGLIPMGKGPVLTPARTYMTATDANEDSIGYDNPTDGLAPGRTRYQWSILEQQQASVPVTNLTSSGNTSNNSIAAIQGGIPQNPIAPASVWSSVPQMILPVNAKGPVMIMANLTCQSTAAHDNIAFAIYRDGQLLGNQLTHQFPAATNAPNLVQLSAMDNPPTGAHIYALYWSPGTGTLTAVSNQRNLYAINLQPQ
jgi:hypothetical protein